ncbi:MAG TPA: radical SAM protein [Actinomycetes bacterium]|nr:radical SAM protein [Actinomycetes bacterium]
MTARRSLITDQLAASCYFRTSVPTGQRKALVQITERCNLHCAHCFVSAGDYGDTMRTADIADLLIPRLGDCRVSRVTLTGGEPFAHPDVVEIVATFRAHGFGVGICSNATIITDAQLAALAGIGGIHVNVSLDGFRAESHGRFRGNRASFHTTIETVRKLARAGLLQGLLCTPNNLAEDAEYAELCAFAVDNGAEYVLMNPLSAMGRGVKGKGPLGAAEERMQRIYDLTVPFDGNDLDVVHIRFPNTSKPLAPCEAGTIVYVFTRGELTVCPYLVFAARTPQSRHDPTEFIVGNVFADPDIAARLDAYRFHERYQVGANPTCQGCSLETACGKGCPAAVVSAGERIGAVDAEVCPVTTAERRLLPIASA